ncbi:hypothetical protein K437DRAFT_165978 [Tilletiaria anomala UBC 951]|uniref:Uncharacterized protein n=1 Tax=Tilletiaria anomala (strain ATCC 24038 / CBS 436.72 / UBC 951) TaxID=1037660 RepID=A0A066VL10_TILAU|nr:uncharacterized protein K437DRAFT_165978 [Tilletiaria anomala UBC 951]KDN42176.1 hypothetical protein K437DRAFT_165978 [Tilletiaria anomala UBC 951]
MYAAVSQEENARLRLQKRARRARLAAIEILSEPSLQACIVRQRSLSAATVTIASTDQHNGLVTIDSSGALPLHPQLDAFFLSNHNEQNGRLIARQPSPTDPALASAVADSVPVPRGLTISPFNSAHAADVDIHGGCGGNHCDDDNVTCKPAAYHRHGDHRSDQQMPLSHLKRPSVLLSPRSIPLHLRAAPLSTDSRSLHPLENKFATAAASVPIPSLNLPQLSPMDSSSMLLSGSSPASPTLDKSSPLSPPQPQSLLLSQDPLRLHVRSSHFSKHSENTRATRAHGLDISRGLRSSSNTDVRTIGGTLGSGTRRSRTNTVNNSGGAPVPSPKVGAKDSPLLSSGNKPYSKPPARATRPRALTVNSAGVLQAQADDTRRHRSKRPLSVNIDRQQFSPLLSDLQDPVDLVGLRATQHLTAMSMSLSPPVANPRPAGTTSNAQSNDSPVMGYVVNHDSLGARVGSTFASQNSSTTSLHQAQSQAYALTFRSIPSFSAPNSGTAGSIDSCLPGSVDPPPYLVLPTASDIDDSDTASSLKAPSTTASPVVDTFAFAALLQADASSGYHDCKSSIKHLPAANRGTLQGSLYPFLTLNVPDQLHIDANLDSLAHSLHGSPSLFQSENKYDQGSLSAHLPLQFMNLEEEHLSPLHHPASSASLNEGSTAADGAASLFSTSWDGITSTPSDALPASALMPNSIIDASASSLGLYFDHAPSNQTNDTVDRNEDTRMQWQPQLLLVSPAQLDVEVTTHSSEQQQPQHFASSGNLRYQAGSQSAVSEHRVGPWLRQQDWIGTSSMNVKAHQPTPTRPWEHTLADLHRQAETCL